ANIARVASLRAGVPESVPSVTIMRNCASGMEAIYAAQMRMRAGAGDAFLVGGTESMSNYPLLMNDRLVQFFTRLSKAKSLGQRIATIASFRPGFLKPRVAILEGLTDPVSGLMMGNTAENVARHFGIDRAAQDAFALSSHQRAAAAQVDGRLQEEIASTPVGPRFDHLVEADNGIRSNQTSEALAKLRPVFDKREGNVTVGNSCQVTDGAAAMLVMSEQRAEQLDLAPLAILAGHGHAGLDPRMMGLGPVHATPAALREAGIGFEDLQRFEINEAFAAQVLACRAAFASGDYCRQKLGLEGPLGDIEMERLNADGGAIALGHPIAATGARIVLSLARQLRAAGERYGLASLCIGGGQGQAFVVEAA
ncbi:MAG: acetyl-CoA C-acyltransferase, partial [Planctomycetota bacterium]|nr:acetyl-CoA C-acyltransferase [Planctomycetota bacterium]